MTVQETGRVMDALETAYPRYYAGIDNKRRERAVIMWASAFEKDDPRLVAAAVRSFAEMDEKGFPPVPGQIKAKMRLITGRGELTEAEAWNLVTRAVNNSAYHAAEEFGKLPEQLQKLVGNPAKLRAWASMEQETLQSVVASNFRRSYREDTAKAREYAALPPDIRNLIGLIPARTVPGLEGGGGNGK